MQRDFHYGIIKLLALNAGFPSEQAEIIAYASQYVDDATFHKPVKLSSQLDLDTHRAYKNKFDPVCTAHKGLQFLQDFKNRVQEQIYLSFHFLPPQPYTGQKNYSYLTQPNSSLAQILILWATAKLKSDYSLENLIRLGIALHTYADTWAHQNFSGLHSSVDNDIEQIEIWQLDHWKKIKPYKQLIFNLVPSIGHGEAYDFPDRPYLRWRYIKQKTKQIIIRDNPAIFTDAAKKIFSILCSITGKNCDWDQIRPWFKKYVEFNSSKTKERCNYLKLLFPNINFNYNDKLWLEQALEYSRIRRTYIYKAKPKGDMKWFLFHKVAYEQRKFILNKIKRLTKLILK